MKTEKKYRHAVQNALKMQQNAPGLGNAGFQLKAKATLKQPQSNLKATLKQP